MSVADPTDRAARVLVVEDEPKIAAVLRDYLQAAGHEVRLHASGEGAVEAALAWPAELLVLDVQLPGRDGYSICRELRQRSGLPILLLTARVEEADRMRGFELGADDYVCKPFSPREVVARVRALLRRAAPATAAALRALELDDERHLAQVHGQALELTPVEYRLLSALARRPGVVLSRNQLIDAAYPDFRVVSERTIDSHLKNLRRKLDAAWPGSGEGIGGVYGLGYRFVEDAWGRATERT